MWPRLLVPVAALLSGLAVWAVLPAIVPVFNDDFGYLRSVVETVRRGRPWTDDWLEPWAAGLSVLSALLFQLTGSFTLAIQGLQAALAAVSAGALTALLRRRGHPAAASVAITAVALTFPTVLFKLFEYGAMTLCIPCLLLAVLFAEQRRWSAFFLIWLLAVSTRQSAAAWLALPAAAFLTAPRRGLRPALVCVGGVLACFLLQRAMNETHAQRVMTTAMWPNLHLQRAAIVFAMATGVFLTAAGLGGFLLRTLARDPTPLRATGTLYLRVLAAAATAAFCIVDPTTLMEIEHGLFAREGGPMELRIVFALAAAGWLLGGFRLRHDLACGALACALLVSLRGTVWDYYLLDVAVLGALAAAPPAAAATGPAPWWLCGSGWLALAVLAWFHLGFVSLLKRDLDWHADRVRLCEPALRSSRISVREISVAPFGYHGWHLYPWFVAHDGAGGAYIADFEQYLVPDALRIEAGPMPDRGDALAAATEAGPTPMPEDAAALAAGTFPFGWTGRVHLQLHRNGEGKPAPLALDLGEYRLTPFPLNDAEWHSLIAR